MTDEMRAEFEVAFRAQFGFGATDVRDSNSEEGAALMGAALWAWEASREAVVVELPNRAAEAYREEFDDVEGGSFNEAAYIRDVRKAIEAQGLRVAP